MYACSLVTARLVRIRMDMFCMFVLLCDPYVVLIHTSWWSKARVSGAHAAVHGGAAVVSRRDTAHILFNVQWCGRQTVTTFHTFCNTYKDKNPFTPQSPTPPPHPGYEFMSHVGFPHATYRMPVMHPLASHCCLCRSPRHGGGV